MKTDNPNAWCVQFPDEQMALIQQQAAAKHMTEEDFIRAIVRRALATERVEVTGSPTLKEVQEAIRDGEVELSARLKELERKRGRPLPTERVGVADGASLLQASRYRQEAGRLADLANAIGPNTVDDFLALHPQASALIEEAKRQMFAVVGFELATRLELHVDPENPIAAPELCLSFDFPHDISVDVALDLQGEFGVVWWYDHANDVSDFHVGIGFLEERSDGAQMAAERAVEAVARRRT